MKFYKSLIMLTSAVTALSATNAYGQEAQDWSITVTPRYQQVFFEPSGADGVETMSTYGATVAVREPSQRWGLTGTFLTGKKKNGSYDFKDTGSTYDYRLKRTEYQAAIEYTPSDTGVTLLGGYHHFKVKQNESLADPLPGNSEINSYNYSINAAEIGLRLASRLGANSRHAVTAQFLFGVGEGRYKVNEREVFSGFTNSNVGNDKGTGYLADIALGYSWFLTNHVSLGARARGYVFYVDAGGSDPIFAIIPEANLSFRF